MVIDREVLKDIPDWVNPIDNPEDAYEISQFLIKNEEKAYTAHDLEENTEAISDGSTDKETLNDLIELGILSKRMNHYALENKDRAETYTDLIDEYGDELFDTTPNDTFPED